MKKTAPGKTAELVARQRELERKNAKLRKMCADLALRIDIVQTARLGEVADGLVASRQVPDASRQCGVRRLRRDCTH